MFQSAPRAPARGDCRRPGLRDRQRCFNPRPAHPRGATWDEYQQHRHIWVSIRAPRTRAGRPARALTVPQDLRVSIRAPRTRAGRPTITCTTSPASTFQSAPRAPARGDSYFNWPDVILFQFQSAPRAPARGDIKPDVTLRILSRFQSAPRAPARGDQAVPISRLESKSFNPRPAHPRGATSHERADSGIGAVVSIRAPRTRAGRLVSISNGVASKRVSIRAPRTRAGRR